MTREQFQQRWCYKKVFCSLPEDMEEPPHIHWTAGRAQCRRRPDVSTWAHCTLQSAV